MRQGVPEPPPNNHNQTLATGSTQIQTSLSCGAGVENNLHPPRFLESRAEIELVVIDP